MRIRLCTVFSVLRLTALPVVFLTLAVPAAAAELGGLVTDPSGGVLRGAVVRLLNIASGQQVTSTTDAGGRYRFTDVKMGTYRVAASFQGFSEASRAVVIASEAAVTVDLKLELGVFHADAVNVTAMRGARDADMVPLRVDTLSAGTLRELLPVSIGEALAVAPGVTLVGSGPFQMRPRVRGLDSTRVLVLVDGQRLNNARTATDRAGVEVGLITPDTIEGVEVLGGAGSVLYGTDALAGTINIVTRRPTFTETRRLAIGFDGLYSSNDNGRRGTVTLGVSDRRWAVLFQGGAERFEDYRAAADFSESSISLLASGTIRQADTIDSNFPGFTFRAFPEAFNAPFTRASAAIPRSAMEGSSARVSAVAMVRPGQELQVGYLGRHATNVGFPDFQPPFFFQTITLPRSTLDKFSAAYAFVDVAPWFKKLSISTYVQRQDRLLRNEFPVQFPAPTPQSFFPINVFRLNILSDTRQRVWTPGVEVQANLQLQPNHVLTAGLTWFRDRSEDERTTSTQMTQLGFVALGPRGPAATVFPAPVALGPPTIDHPVRVPNASFRNTALFIQDELNLSPSIRLTAGIRIDDYRIATDATPGYSVQSLISGAVPAIDPATLPDISGESVSRTALTGEAGVILFAHRPLRVFAHYARSYRHPNLEELLFSGPATAGNIVPNVTVRPETGNNFDAGVRVRAGRLAGSAVYFVNHYRNFISTEVVANSPAGSISQATNLATVRIHGLEAQADVSFRWSRLVWSPYAAGSVTRGTVLSGTSPLTNASLAGAPQDNISPWKLVAGVRMGDERERWWGTYGVRAHGKVTRVSPLLSDSPFLIAQDLLGLEGFAIHRLAGGYNWRAGNQRLGLSVSVENLTDTFYREQFQFAPGRGRSVMLALSVGGQ